MTMAKHFALAVVLILAWFEPSLARSSSSSSSDSSEDDDCNGKSSKNKNKRKNKKCKDDPDTAEPSFKNIVWLLMDDVSTERFPESGNEALKGLLPGLEEFKADGAVYYPHFYAPSSVCAPAQVALFSGMEPADIGGQYQFSNNQIPGKVVYRTVPPDEVEFAPEKFRSFGYWSTGGGKLDYQVGDVMPTFYNEILGGAFTDINSYMEQCWSPAIEQDRPFFAMLNMMDNHQAISTNTQEAPIPITDEGTVNLPFGSSGYSKPSNLLFNTGENGSPQEENTASQDLLEADIVGYSGAFDENSISHANGGVPGYLPDEIGVRSILSREYDLIRNMDFRISTVIRRLKELDVYDDTMIVIFGDHGSGTYKAKILLQPQSVRTPMWIKYPKDTDLSKNVKEDKNGMLVDDQMTHITDIYPTTLSVLGVEPEAYMTGRALEGPFRDRSPERKIMHALVARIGDIQGVKTFTAFSKKMFYQKHALTADAIAQREADGFESPQVLADATRDSRFFQRFQFFPASPLFDRMQKLLLVNALNPSYGDEYKFIVATDATAPSDVLYDLEDDPFGTVNLLMDYHYDVGMSAEVQKWGNNVASVNLSYGELTLSGLNKMQRRGYEELRHSLTAWIEDQTYISEELDWSEGLFGEENRMAREFWPGEVQPLTANVQVEASGEMTTETPGTIFRYSVVTEEERSVCEALGTAVKASIAEMSPTNSGFAATSYVSLRNGRTYTGYLYTEASGRPISFQDFFGSRVGCTVFISDDATFMEVDCPEAPPFVFDSRDSTWDGTQWVGVDPVTGEWLSEPVTLYDEASKNWNFGAFHPYVFGPNRNEVYSGLNEDGTEFEPIASTDTPYNFFVKAAPTYFATGPADEDPFMIPSTFDETEALVSKGWSLVNDPPSRQLQRLGLTTRAVSFCG